MSQDSKSTALDVRRDDTPDRGVPLAPVTDAELIPLFRTAKALADSGLFKDVRQPGQAFAKMLAGRDLGLTPFEAMTSLHVIEGKIEAGADLHATRVRQRDGYDFRVAWLKVEGPPEVDGQQPKVEAVWADEEALDDLRDVYGCAIVFYVGDEQRGISRFTQKDAATAQLLDRNGPGGGPGNHKKFPRNMMYARAMTNGVAWFVPEVMGGMRVYGHGEIASEPGEDLTGGEAEAPTTETFPIEVEALIARAKELGHAGLANREAWAVRVNGNRQALATALKAATSELNRIAAGKVSPSEPEVPDAIVVEEPTAEPATAPEDQADAEVLAEAHQAMRDRLEELEDRLARAAEDETLTSDDTADMEAEAEHLRAQLGAQADPAQSDLGL